jgi:ATP-binding protein involved in chromosome partitioning
MSTSADVHRHLLVALESFRDPESGRPISQTGQVTDWVVTESQIRCSLRLSTHSAPIAQEVADRLQEHLVNQTGTKAEVRIATTLVARSPATLGQIGLRATSVIAVGSGKGGVGKSTVAASIALTLGRLGARVGLMDADVYGPSIPQLLGLSGRPEMADGKIRPIRSGSMPVMSMGFLVEKSQAVIWRGPMLHGSIVQFLRDTAWGELDYLIIDMPPGTGDIALTLSQTLPLAGAVVVCTPQEVALLDAIKAIAMFQKTNIPVLGIVENMSGFTCPDTGKTYDIFGRGGARAKAEELGLPFLGDIPIQMHLRSQSDEGNLSLAIQAPETSPILESVVRRMVWSLAANAAKAGAPSASLPVLG